MAEHHIQCFRCALEWTFEPPLGRASECPSCSADARACRNCQFFDRHAHKQCRETQADLVQDKDRSNFCGYFSAAAQSRYREKTERDESRSALEKLFGTPPVDQNSDSPKTSSLDELFGDFLQKAKPKDPNA